MGVFSDTAVMYTMLLIHRCGMIQIYFMNKYLQLVNELKKFILCFFWLLHFSESAC